MTSPAPRLALEAITRRFGTVTALDAATFTVTAGEVHALLGENGAGKSTLMKIAFGLDQPDGGRILLDGLPMILPTPRAAMAQGVGMVQQHFALVDAMTVGENVALGTPGRLDLAATHEMIRRISRDAGLPLDPDAVVSTLPIGAQQRLEIIKALVRDTTILILDEPTAVLSPSEATDLLAWTRRFADAGGSVVLIAHKLREVLSIADRVTVLRRGRTVLTADARATTESSLASAMLGQSDVAADAVRRSVTPSIDSTSDVLRLENVSARDDAGVERIRQVTLSVRRGEIVGIAAIEGAGQHQLLRVLSGRIMPTHGTVTLPAHVGFVPEDRHRDAVVLDATLTENVALRGAAERRGRMPWRELRESTTALLQQRDVRAASEDAPMRTLSGGNQQKLVIGRELANAPAALVVENPTRGLDIRATADVHAALRAARGAGTAVVVYSSDLDEVLLLADRIFVVVQGGAREVRMDRDDVGRAMLTAGS